MKIRGYNKSTPEEIRNKFDNEVHKYDNLEKGQQSAMFSAIIMETVSRMAGAVCPNAEELLDIGCGGGNYSLKTLAFMPKANCTLIDLSSNMLAKARERIVEKTSGKVETMQGDIRQLDLPENKFDIVIAATSLHHLREDHEWEDVFGKIFRSLKPKGAFFVSDLVLHDHEAINMEAWKDYWNYLKKEGGEDLKKWVFEQIDKEDSPQTLSFQTQLMWKCGFKFVEILFRSSVFAAFCGVK